MRRISILVGIAVVLNLALITPALAAAAGNDTVGGATVISGLPFTDSVDTTEATTDADDAEANSRLRSTGHRGQRLVRGHGHRRWARSSSTWVRRITDAGVIVVTGTRAAFDLVACDAISVVFEHNHGRNLRIMVFDVEPGNGNGGMMEITVDEAPPPPEISLTVNPIGQKTKSGSAIVSGTVTCTGTNIEFAFIDVQLQQRVGRLLINGFGHGRCPLRWRHP